MTIVNKSPSWSLQLIGADKLWDLGLTGEGVLVAVIDTGVNYYHPDLQAQLWQGPSEFPLHGYNFADDNSDTFDIYGHGTCAASQIVGNGHSGIITGVAPQATLMCLKVGNAEEHYWNAFEFALKYKAHVISMSKTIKYPDKPHVIRWRQLCESMLKQGVLHANSVGNQGNLSDTYPIPHNVGAPANCPSPTALRGATSVISCGVIDRKNQIVKSSGRGPADWSKAPFDDYPHKEGLGLIKPDICAPGAQTIGCNPRYPKRSNTPYSDFMGTSAATAHLGGALALLAQACLRSGKKIQPQLITSAIEATAVKILGQTKQKENIYGAGRIDLYAAFCYGKERGWWS